MISAHHAATFAIARARAAANSIDARFATLPSPPAIPKSATPGQLLAAIAKSQDVSFKATAGMVNALRRDVKAQIAKAYDDLTEAAATAESWLAVAEHLKSGSVIPAETNEIVAVAARTARKAIQAGLQPDVSDEIVRNATAALITIREAEASISRIKSAAMIAINKGAAALYTKRSQSDFFQPAERVLFDSLAKKYATVANARTARHRTGYNGGAK